MIPSEWRTRAVPAICVTGCLLFTSFLHASVQAQEWTRFRGPDGSGAGKGEVAITRITPADYNWRVPLPGVGHSCPVIWGKSVFVTSGEEQNGKRHLLCLDTATGQRRWTKSFDFTAYHHHEYNNTASSTPTVDAEHVYLIWSTPTSYTVYALNHAGKEVWKRDLGAYPTNHGGASSPIVIGDLLVVAKEPDKAMGCLVGLDRKTGEIRWKRERQSRDAAYATPLLYRPKQGPAEVVFSSTVHGITSLNPQNGELNWEVPGTFRARCVASPIQVQDLVFATAGNGAGDKQAVAVRPGSKTSGVEPKVEYLVKRGLSYVPTPIHLGERLFMWADNGLVTCLRADNGEPIWSERVGGTFFGSPISLGGKLYAMSVEGELVVLDASDQFQVVTRANLGEGSRSTPAVAGGVLYLRTEGHLISVGGKQKAATSTLKRKQ